MTIEHGYTTREWLKAAMRDTSTVFDELYDLAITSASRLVDEWTGRSFWRAEPDTLQVYRATLRTEVVVRDYADTTGMTVFTDDNNDGVFENQWQASWWQAEPFNPINGWPYTRITTTTRDREFPIDGRRPRVKVVNRPGWTTHPTPVGQATQLISKLLFQAKDITGADLGVSSGDNETGPLSRDPLAIARTLLIPYALDGSPLKTASGTT